MNPRQKYLKLCDTFEPQSITVEPALGKQPTRLLALTLCERSGDLGIPVRQIREAGRNGSPIAIHRCHSPQGRALRMMKLRQKISGTDPNYGGTDVFCSIRGYTSTARKNRYRMLDATLGYAYRGSVYSFSQLCGIVI